MNTCGRGHFKTQNKNWLLSVKYLLIHKMYHLVQQKSTLWVQKSTLWVQTKYPMGTNKVLYGYKKIMQLIFKYEASFSTGGASFREYTSLKDDLPSNPKFSFEASGLSVQSLCDLCHWEFWRCTFRKILIGLYDLEYVRSGSF